jgi:FdhD protein
MRSKVATVPVRRETAHGVSVTASAPSASENNFQDNSFQDLNAQDFVAVEDPLQIRLNGTNLAITMRTPGDDRALAAGFLFTEGLVDDAAHISGFEEDGKGTISVRLAPGVDSPTASATRNFYMTSSCGVCGKASIDSLRAAGCTSLPSDRPKIAAQILTSLPDKLRADQSVFERTGGLHAAGLFDAAGKLLDLKEDVGRHNAVDKLIGAALLAGQLPLDQHVLMLSGRVSFELVQKALRARIPIIAAIGAPSSLAVETALRFGMTLAGFVRNGTFNLYSGAGRVVATR